MRHDTSHALSLRKTVFHLEFGGIFRKKNETLVETRHALSHAACVHNGYQCKRTKPFVQLFEMLNQRTEEITSSFFLKKNYPTRQKILQNPKNLTYSNSNKKYPIRKSTFRMPRFYEIPPQYFEPFLPQNVCNSNQPDLQYTKQFQPTKHP
jgi:hypothetical protein